MIATSRVPSSLRQKLGLVAFGFFLTFVALEAALRLGGFIILSLQEHKNAAALRQKGTYRIICIGESTTEREYPAFLEQALNGRNLGLRFSVIDRGLSGTKSTFLVGRMAADLEAYHPDMVVAMMGINDSGPHMPYDPETSSKTVRIIRALRTYKLTKIVWMHIAGPGRRARDVPYGAAVEKIEVNKQKDIPAPAQRASKKKPGVISDADLAYAVMGWMYSDHAQYAEAETAFKKALKIDPGHYKAHVGLGWALQGQGKYVEAAAVYKQALGIDPEKVSAYAGVLWAYLCGGGDSSALQDFLKKSVAENSVPTDQLYGALATLYAAMGTPGLARQYHEKAEQLRLKEYDPVVADNYRHLKAMLDQRGVRLVCVQYPMLGLEPLRKIFQGQADGIVFVDNERVFKDAVKRSSLREYFRDMFGGDFGHCTDKGNQLLAGNIADVIAREVFGK